MKYNYMRKYERKSVHSIEEVRNALGDLIYEKSTRERPKIRIDFDGDSIKANSLRYLVFFTKGMKCPICGAEGAFFAKEKNNSDLHWHLNLYAIDEDGDELLMTKDHIVPRSKGGKDTIENLQPMCVRCNVKKADHMNGEKYNG